MALHTINEEKIDVLFISEPNRIPDQSGWTGESTDDKYALYINENQQVLRTGADTGFAWTDLDNLSVYSCYYSSNCRLEEFQEFLDTLHESIIEATGEVIVSGNFNAHSQIWGSRATDKRGEALLEMAEYSSLVVINDGIVPIFRAGTLT